MKTFYEMLGIIGGRVDEISASPDFSPVSPERSGPRNAQGSLGPDANKQNIIPFLLSKKVVEFMSNLDLDSSHIKNVIGRMREQKSEPSDPMLITYVSNTELHYMEAAAREMVMHSMRMQDDESGYAESLGIIGVIVLKSVEYARKISAGEEI